MTKDKMPAGEEQPGLQLKPPLPAPQPPQIRVVHKMPDGRLVGYDTFEIDEFGVVPEVGDVFTTITDDGDYEPWAVNCRYFVREIDTAPYWLLETRHAGFSPHMDALVTHTLLVTDFHEAPDGERVARMKDLLGERERRLKPKERYQEIDSDDPAP